MRTLLLASVAGAGLLAAPALAHAADQQQGQSKAAAPQQDDRTLAMTQERLRQSLVDAGFVDVTVVDATYLVRAQSPDGDQVMMLIDPPKAGADSAAEGGGDQNQTSSTKQ